MIAPLLKLYGNFVLDNYPIQLQNKENILLFANINNTGIGNLVWLYPVMKALDRKGLVVVCDHPEMQRILQYNLTFGLVCAFNHIPDRKYGVSVSNFLTQTKQNVEKIIDLRIPCRIGHVGIVEKYRWLFNYTVTTAPNIQERESNARLLHALDLEPAPLHIDLPPAPMTRKKYDLLIQVNTSNEPIRNYAHYEKVINALDCRIGLIGSKKESADCARLANKTKAVNLSGLSLIETAHLMKRAVVVGNDGGLVKLAYATGAPVIQIVKRSSEYLNRSWIKGSTLMDPEPEVVVELIKRRLGEQ